MATYIQAILVNIPNAKCSVNELTGEITEWNGPGEPPSFSQLQAWKNIEREKPVPLTMSEKVELMWETFVEGRK